ncbi:MAG: class I SAM-dependent methyltransferase [Thermoplasmata archaeon]|nr:class I SAM-dependent methyltransferase [Thermoplasmata archaeon]
MAEMSRVGRWLVNAGNARRSRRLLDSIGNRLPLPSSPRLLELGAGRGGLSALLQQRYRPGHLVVTDYDPRQVEAARAYLSGELGPLPPTIELRPLDARVIPFGDGSFDGVFAINMLHHVEAEHSEYRERPGVLRQIRRVLSPGGCLVFRDFSRTRDVRQTLRELGFIPLFEKPGWRGRYLGVFQSPS